MDFLISVKTSAILISFGLLFCAERFFPRDLRTEPKQRLFKNIAFWPIAAVLSIIIILPVTHEAAQWHLWERPLVLQSVLLDIILLDAFIYFWHRALHEVPFLWRFHQVHHHDRMLDTTTALRFHFGELTLSAMVRAIFIMLLAIPFTSVLWFEGGVLIAALFHHSNIKLPGKLEGFLSRIIITPSIHWVHHHAKRADTDANYGTILSVWDPIFRTRSSFKRTDEMSIGIEEIPNDLPFWKLLTVPFKKKK